MTTTIEHKYVLPNDYHKTYDYYKMLVNGMFFSVDSDSQPVLGGQVLLAANEEEHNDGEDYVYLDEKGTLHLLGARITDLYEEHENIVENFSQDVLHSLENSLELAGVSLNTEWSGYVELHPDITISTFNPEESEPFYLAVKNRDHYM